MSDDPKPQAPGSAAPNKPADHFREALAIMDDSSWIWALSQSAFQTNACPVVRLPASTTIRHSWNRFRHARCIVLHWEAKGRSGGAIIEEILDVDPRYDVSNKVIVLTTNPIHEDVVYFSELGIRRIVRVRNREKDAELIRSELQHHVDEATLEQPKSSLDGLWRKVLTAIDRLPQDPDPNFLAKIEENMGKLRGSNKPIARDLDAAASVLFLRKDHATAFQYWNAALQSNPNYFRTYNNLIQAHRSLGQHQDAYKLMQKMQLLNRNHIGRLVAMGETQLALKDDHKAGHYFKCALEKDAWCSGALNGMADLKFREGDLEGARSLLEKSSLSYRFAAILNLQGIEMVKQGQFASALEHYSKAQYVLPQQEKGPQLFYNIGLCYSRWNKSTMAVEFLKLALIKEPNYKKAQKLLDQIYERMASASQPKAS